MKKQSDSNDAQTPYDETTEVFAVEEPLDETVEIDEQVDLTSTTQMPAADATASVDMNAPLYAQFLKGRRRGLRPRQRRRKR